MNILKKNIKFFTILFILLGLFFNSNLTYGASGVGGDNDKSSLYNSGKKLILRAKKLEKKEIKLKKHKNYI